MIGKILVDTILEMDTLVKIQTSV